jgi:WhiB family transcriptional regulator, redox-sensing transcriptional regulator
VVNFALATPLEDCVRDAVDIDLLRPRWMRRAACRGQGFDAWFPPGHDYGEEAEAGKLVCAACPVRAECLDYALDGRIRHGLWGGLTPMERRAFLRQRAPTATPGDSPSRHYAYGR